MNKENNSGNHSSPDSIWNEKTAEQPRVEDHEHPWYFFARNLVLKAGNDCKGKALDVGCGVGEFMRQLIELGFAVRGLDGSPGQVKRLDEWGFDVNLADLEQPLDAPDKTYDLVTCLEVIEHIVHAERMIKEMSRVLADEGYMIISTPNFACWQNRLRYLRGSPPVNEGVHIRFFTPDTLRQVISEAGLMIVESSSYAPFTGVNYLRRQAGKAKMFWITRGWNESLFAETLMYLVKKR